MQILINRLVISLPTNTAYLLETFLGCATYRSRKTQDALCCFIIMWTLAAFLSNYVGKNDQAQANKKFTYVSVNELVSMEGAFRRSWRR